MSDEITVKEPLRRILTSTLFVKDEILDKLLLPRQKQWIIGLKDGSERVTSYGEGIKKVHCALILICRHLFHTNAPENSELLTIGGDASAQLQYKAYIREVRDAYTAASNIVNNHNQPLDASFTETSKDLVEIFQKGYTAYYGAKYLRVEYERTLPDTPKEGYREKNEPRPLSVDGKVGEKTILALDEELNRCRYYRFDESDYRNPVLYHDNSRSVAAGFFSLILYNKEARGHRILPPLGVMPATYVAVVEVVGNHVELLHGVTSIRIKNSSVPSNDGVYELMDMYHDKQYRNCSYDKLQNITHIYVKQSIGVSLDADFTFDVEYEPGVFIREHPRSYEFEDGVDGRDASIELVTGAFIPYSGFNETHDIYIKGDWGGKELKKLKKDGTERHVTINSSAYPANNRGAYLAEDSQYFETITVTLQDGTNKILEKVTRVTLADPDLSLTFTEDWSFNLSFVEFPHEESNCIEGAFVEQADGIPSYVYIRGNWQKELSLSAIGSTPLEIVSVTRPENSHKVRLYEDAVYHDEIAVVLDSGATTRLQNVTKLVLEGVDTTLNLTEDFHFNFHYGEIAPLSYIEDTTVLEDFAVLNSNDRVIVHQIFDRYWENGDEKVGGGTWCHVEIACEDKEISESYKPNGYIRFEQLWTNSEMPEGRAKLYRTDETDTSILDIVRKHYGAYLDEEINRDPALAGKTVGTITESDLNDRPGLRYLANALLYTNNPTGKDKKNLFALDKNSGRYELEKNTSAAVHINGQRSWWDFFPVIDLGTGNRHYPVMKPDMIENSYSHAHLRTFDEWEKKTERQFNAAGMVRTDWKNTVINPNCYLWLPSYDFLMSLRRVVSPGELLTDVHTWDSNDIINHYVALIQSEFEPKLRKVLEYIPNGVGFTLEGHFDATFEIPLALEGGGSCYIWREDDENGKAHFKLQRTGHIGASFDTGLGAGGWLGSGVKGKKSVKGKDVRYGVGLEIGAQLRLGVKIFVDEVYDFPVQEDFALCNLLIAILDTQADTNIPGKVLSALFMSGLRSFNLDPREYLVKASIWANPRYVGDVTAEATVRIGDIEEGNEKYRDWKMWEKSEENHDLAEKLSFFSVPGFLSFINTIAPGISASYHMEKSVKLGVEMTMGGEKGTEWAIEPKTGHRYPKVVNFYLIGDVTKEIKASAISAPIFGFPVFSTGDGGTVGLKVGYEAHFDYAPDGQGLIVALTSLNKLKPKNVFITYSDGELANYNGSAFGWELELSLEAVFNAVKVFFEISGLKRPKDPADPMKDLELASTKEELTIPWIWFALKYTFVKQMENLGDLIISITVKKRMMLGGLLALGSTDAGMATSAKISSLVSHTNTETFKDLTIGTLAKQIAPSIEGYCDIVFKAKPAAFIDAIGKLASTIIAEVQKTEGQEFSPIYVFQALKPTEPVPPKYVAHMKDVIATLDLFSMDLAVIFKVLIGFGFHLSAGGKIRLQVGAGAGIVIKVKYTTSDAVKKALKTIGLDVDETKDSLGRWSYNLITSKVAAKGVKNTSLDK